LLRKILKDFDVEIEHIGSTAIKGLAAKPIIDIAIGMPDISKIDQIKPVLEIHGFIYRGDRGSRGGFLFVVDSEVDIRTHHIHVLDVKDSQWSNYIKFRNQLRTSKKLREEYQDLKRELELRYRNDRPLYTDGKKEFIQSVIES